MVGLSIYAAWSSISTADKVVVGLSSEVILQRKPAVSPHTQLAQATEYLDMRVKSSKICFSFNVRTLLSVFLGGKYLISPSSFLCVCRVNLWLCMSERHSWFAIL